MTIKSIIEAELGQEVIDLKITNSGILVLCSDGSLFMFTHIVKMGKL